IRTYTLTRNPNFYDEGPYIDTITFEFFPDFGSAAEALIKRRVDGMSFLPLDYRSQVEQVRSVEIYTPRLPQYTAIFFNKEHGNPALTDIRVRQALAYALDKNQILSESLGHAALSVHGPI